MKVRCLFFGREMLNSGAISSGLTSPKVRLSFAYATPNVQMCGNRPRNC